ncbi:MAG: DNA methyltransferase, partial [Thermoplasmata archaeon]
ASAAVRRLGSPSSGAADDAVLRAGRAFKSGGGTIDLDHPDRRFWLARGADGTDRLFEEVAAVDRRSASARRMPTLPFQRPVSLPPRLARAAANLARVRSGDRIVDPFVGTGALLAEAGLLGARLYGIDRDAEMVRGALRNFTHLGVTAEELVVGDAGEAEFGGSPVPFDAVLTDPPYGRGSSTGGEGSAEVVDRVLPRWAARVRPGGRLVVIVPAPVEDPGPEWHSVVTVPVRVHRSLTREFQVYERAGVTTRSE